MNHYSSAPMLVVSQAHLDNLRREAEAYRLAELAKGDRPSRITSLVNRISTFSKRLTSRRASSKTQVTTLRERRA